MRLFVWQTLVNLPKLNMPYFFYRYKTTAKLLQIILLCGLLLFVFSFSVAQTQHVKDSVTNDSLRAALHNQDSVASRAKQTDTSISNLLDKVEYYTASYNQLNSALSRTIDTAAISSGLPRTENGIKIIREALSNNDQSSTLRYLYAVRDILMHLEDRLNDWQEKLGVVNNRLVKIQSKILEFRQDPALKYIPAESKLRKQYILQLTVLNAKFSKLEAISQSKFLSIGLLQNRVVDNFIRITDYKNQINFVLNRFGERAVNKEFPYLWQSSPGTYQNSFSSAWDDTLQMNKRLFRYFVISNYDIHFLGLLLLIGFYYWSSCSIKKIRKNSEAPETVFKNVKYIYQHKSLSAILISAVIILFFYDHPPVIFTESMMLVMMLCTGFLIAPYWPKQLHRYWWLMVVAMLFYSFSNLFIRICYADRILIFLLSIFCLTAGFSFIKRVKASGIKFSNWYLTAFRVFIALQAISLLLNVFGRFSIAKLIGVTALSALWQAVSLLVFVKILMEALFLYLESGKTTENATGYIEYKTLEGKLQNILRLIAGIFWLVWLAESFNIIDYLIDFSTDVLTQAHKIGDTTFTYGNVLVFVIIIWIASTLSRIITYFFEFADQHAVTITRKSKLSSSILLVKLSIFGVGFLLAIIASSIPVEKINIIIGALSVGIGFGLQTIVNNLVSGVILAFEKPVQIGDLIEVGGHTGKIKEMGIRASKIATYEGSEIIVPNGDLLSQHLVNWTLSNNNRRVELLVGVAYGSEIKRVRQLLYSLIIRRDDVMKEPEPMVLIHNFGDNSVDFRVLFWVADISKWLELKSMVMTDIYESFAEQGIEIPFPQRDLHLYYPQSEGKDTLKTASAENDPATNLHPDQSS